MSSPCNLCGQISSNEELVDILSNPSLKEKVQKYLPFIDLKPKCSLKSVPMCSVCKESVDQWNLFYLKCAQARKTLHSFLFDPPVAKKKKRTYCCGMYCSNTDLDEKMFHLPKNPARAKQWLLNAGRTDLVTPDLSVEMLRCRNLTLCGVHFERRMFSNELRGSLVATAVPRLFPCGGVTSKSPRLEDPVHTEGRKILPKPLIAYPSSLPENKENQSQLPVGQGNETTRLIGPFILMNDTSMTSQSDSPDYVFTLQVASDHSRVVPTGSVANVCGDNGGNMHTDSQVIPDNPSNVNINCATLNASSTQVLLVGSHESRINVGSNDEHILFLDQLQLDQLLSRENNSLSNVSDLRPVDTSLCHVACPNVNVLFREGMLRIDRDPIETATISATDFVCPSATVELTAQDITSAVAPELRVKPSRTACASEESSNQITNRYSNKQTNSGVTSHNIALEEVIGPAVVSALGDHSYGSQDSSSYIPRDKRPCYASVKSPAPNPSPNSLISCDAVHTSARTSSTHSVKLNRARLEKSKIMNCVTNSNVRVRVGPLASATDEVVETIDHLEECFVTNATDEVVETIDDLEEGSVTNATDEVVETIDDMEQGFVTNATDEVVETIDDMEQSFVTNATDEVVETIDDMEEGSVTNDSEIEIHSTHPIGKLQTKQSQPMENDHDMYALPAISGQFRTTDSKR